MNTTPPTPGSSGLPPAKSAPPLSLRPAGAPPPAAPAAPGGPPAVAPKPAAPPLPSLKKPPVGQNLAPKPKPKIQTVVQQGNIAVVTILESRILDESNVNEIGRALMELVTKQYMIKMIIDLGEVKYLSSAVLRQLIALYKAIKQEKGDLKLCRVNPEVREVFKITQLDKMIEIKDDLETAINAFKKQGGFGFFQR